MNDLISLSTRGTILLITMAFTSEEWMFKLPCLKHLTLADTIRTYRHLSYFNWLAGKSCLHHMAIHDISIIHYVTHAIHTLGFKEAFR